MAVFTQVNPADLVGVIDRFSLGTLERLEGIGAGIENTNYFLDTSKEGATSHWVLTVFENIESSQLPYFVALTRHLADKGLSVPAPLLDEQQRALFQLHGKDAMIVPCLSGNAIKQPNHEQCAEAGRWLARMHNALSDFDQERPLVRDLNWMQENVRQLRESKIPADDMALLELCVVRYSDYREQLMACPQGTVHGDLFHDNALFDGDRLTGVIDFYHACSAGLLFDLAVCANDWTTGAEGDYEPEKLEALVKAYQSERPWTEEERKAWPLFLEVAALRFWISRLSSKYLSGYQQDSVAGETIKNPGEMRDIISQLHLKK